MSFVNEIIGEEDKSKIDWTKFKAWPFSQPHKPWKWTIDKERNAFLVSLEGCGPYGERPEVFVLCWRKEIIRFEAEIHSDSEAATGFDLFWIIRNLGIPDSLKLKREEIIDDLKEAIEAYGVNYRRERVGAVHVEITGTDA
jgi:hypothetical protein